MPCGRLRVGTTRTSQSVGERVDLLGGEDDVAVVGQQDHALGVGRAHAVEQILDRRVHGLPAAHDAVGAEAA